MKRCFLLVLLFIAMMAPAALAQSGAEEIVWSRYVGSINDIKFSHNGKYIGFYDYEIIGVVRASDGVLLWKDSLPTKQPYSGIVSMAFSPDDSLLAYFRGEDMSLYLNYTENGALYNRITVDDAMFKMSFIDSSRILSLGGITTIFDFKSAVVIDSIISDFRPIISETGKYTLVMPETKPYPLKKLQLCRVTRENISTAPLELTGDLFPEVQEGGGFFSRDDKLMVLVPNSIDHKYPDGMPLYVYDLETLVGRKVVCPGIKKSISRFFVDADKKHVVIWSKRDGDTTFFEDNIIVSLEDGSIKNYYRIVDDVNERYLLGEISDASPDSLHYVSTYTGKITFLNAVRTTTGMQQNIAPNGNINVFPNPSSSSGQSLTIEGLSGVQSVIISNLSGNEVFRSGALQSGSEEKITLELPSLPNGAYFITITNIDGKKTTKKLMVGR